MERRLAQRVVSFDNESAPLIPTLLRVAAVYHLPLGIERLTPEALNEPVHVRIRDGTVAGLLDACVRQIPGYAWRSENGAADIFGQRERRETSNLFNLVIPAFSVRDQTIDAASEKLHRALVVEVLKPRGIVGSYLGTPELEERRFSLAVRHSTVRQLLNYLVALDGGTVWIARVLPGCLSLLPQGGIWVIVPHSVQDPRGLLDISGCKGR